MDVRLDWKQFGHRLINFHSWMQMAAVRPSQLQSILLSRFKERPSDTVNCAYNCAYKSDLIVARSVKSLSQMMLRWNQSGPRSLLPVSFSPDPFVSLHRRSQSPLKIPLLNVFNNLMDMNWLFWCCWWSRKRLPALRASTNSLPVDF